MSIFRYFDKKKNYIKKFINFFWKFLRTNFYFYFLMILDFLNNLLNQFFNFPLCYFQYKYLIQINRSQSRFSYQVKF
jgi:hypothetical protein